MRQHPVGVVRPVATLTNRMGLFGRRSEPWGGGALPLNSASRAVNELPALRGMAMPVQPPPARLPPATRHARIAAKDRDDAFWVAGS